MKPMGEDNTYDLISARVVEECGRRGITGVFVMAEVQSPHTSRNTWVLMDMATRKKNFDLLATATSKVNAMRSSRTFRYGVIRMNYVGDGTYKGKDGHRSKDGNFCYAFSGATDEVNAEIERLAYDYHLTLG